MINIGQVMKDGSLYAGPDPDDKKFFLLCKAKDEPELMAWDKADLVDCSFRLPRLNELAVLFAYKRALKFDIDCGWYWSSEDVDHDEAYIQFFTDGRQLLNGKYNVGRVRLVRLVTQEKLEALV